MPKQALKARLKRAGVSQAAVARLAGVTWRHAKYVIDGQRTSANVMRAIDRLAPEKK